MREVEKVFWHSIFHDGWTFYVAATFKGLCCVTLPNESFEVLTAFVQRHFPKAVLEENEVIMEPYVNQLKQYLDHQRTEFSVTYDLRGTPFQISVWNALLTIPHGESKTYSDIGEAIGNPSAVRAVGAAIGANPVPVLVPCHRVVGKGGTLTGYRGGLGMKSALLQLEGWDGIRKLGILVTER